MKLSIDKKNWLIYFWLTGIPAVIVGIVAAINPFTYDMSVPLQEDIECGSLQFTVTFDRDRCVIQTFNCIDVAGLTHHLGFRSNKRVYIEIICVQHSEVHSKSTSSL